LHVPKFSYASITRDALVISDILSGRQMQ